MSWESMSGSLNLGKFFLSMLFHALGEYVCYPTSSSLYGEEEEKI